MDLVSNGPFGPGGLVDRLRQHCAARMDDLQGTQPVLAAGDAAGSSDAPAALLAGVPPLDR